MIAERPGTAIKVGEVTLIPIVEIHLDAVRRSRGLYVWGALRPVAVDVRGRDGVERIVIRADQRT